MPHAERPLQSPQSKSQPAMEPSHEGMATWAVAPQIRQGNLQRLVANSPQVQQVAQWQRAAQPPTLVLRAQASPPLQRKPKDIKNEWTLDMAGNKITNHPAGRRNPSVAWPRNKLEVGANDPFIGGHLFKAEYGGPDNITNVVPWDKGAEKKYATFEAAYKRATEQAAKANGGAASTHISASATFKEESAVKANTIKGYRPSGSKIQKPEIAKIINQTLSFTPTRIKSKDDRDHEIEMGPGDLGHTDGLPADQLTTLVSQSDQYLEGIRDEAKEVEQGN